MMASFGDTRIHQGIIPSLYLLHVHISVTMRTHRVRIIGFDLGQALVVGIICRL